MANQPKMKEILTQAHAQNLLSPSAEKNECLSRHINTANYLLFLLKESNGQGLDNEQFQKRSGLHINTIKVYLRCLNSLGYASRFESANRSPKKEGALKAVWFYKEHLLNA